MLRREVQAAGEQNSVAGATAAATSAATAGKAAGGLCGRAVAGPVRRAKDGKLDRVAFPRALRAGNLLLLVQHDLFKVRLAILTNVFVNGHVQVLF